MISDDASSFLNPTCAGASAASLARISSACSCASSARGSSFLYAYALPSFEYAHATDRGYGTCVGSRFASFARSSSDLV